MLIPDFLSPVNRFINITTFSRDITEYNCQIFVHRYYIFYGNYVRWMYDVLHQGIPFGCIVYENAHGCHEIS